MTEIAKLLLKFGLDEKEITIYLALLKLGPAPASLIATKVSLKRTTIYYALDQLIKKDFVKQSFQHGIKSFRPLDPEDLEKVLDQKISQLNGLRSDLQTELAVLQTFRNETPERPKISFFEGVEGVKRAYEDILKSATEILEIDLPDDIHRVLSSEWVNEFIKKRVQNKILLRALVPDTEIAKSYLLKDNKEYRHCIALPAKEMPMHSSISIYDNKINIINLKNSPFAIIIENEHLAETMRTLYGLAWESAERKTAVKRKRLKN